MRTVRLLDIELKLPEGTRWTVDTPRECRLLYTLESEFASECRSVLEKEAISRGYAVRKSEDTTYMTHGERKIEVYQTDSSRLRLVIDNPEDLPKATVLESSVELGGVLLPIPSGTRVEPLRERHDKGSREWLAEWRLFGAKPGEVAILMHDALVESGLRSGGIWDPPKGGILRWKVEASSQTQLVQIGITQVDDYLVLSAVVVRDV